MRPAGLLGRRWFYPTFRKTLGLRRQGELHFGGGLRAYRSRVWGVEWRVASFCGRDLSGWMRQGGTRLGREAIRDGMG